MKAMFVTFCVKSVSYPSWCWSRVCCGITDSVSL